MKNRSKGILIGIAAFTMAASASATPITFDTNGAGKGFGGTSLFLNSSLGAGASLTYNPVITSTTGTPSNVNFGTFTLLCASCSTQALGAGAFFDAFTFSLIITDATDGATGKFLGTSTGGTVYSDVSQITINWSPLQLGPGPAGALTGNFGNTTFTTNGFVGIVAPNSGAVPGLTTVEGHVDTSVTVSAVPEPATSALMGSALIGLGLLGRRRLRR